MSEKVRIGIVGLGFGSEFIPIYQNHPQAEMVAICQRNVDSLNQIGDAFGVEKRFTDYQEMLADPDIDAIHINTPIPAHAEQSIQALNAGKHCACTVPAATNLEALKGIVRAQISSGKKYMMMETVVYAREYLYVKDLYDSGEMGRLQFLRGSHQQEMAGWPGYWEGLPPMHYATHCIGPLLALSGKLAESVVCHGSGRIDEALILKNGSPFAIETATLSLKDSDVKAEVTRSLFNTARQYRESFDVYCSDVSWEWTLIEHEQSVLHRGEDPERVSVPDFADRLPEGIRKFTTKGVYDLSENTHLSFKQGSGHGGSHPHLAHEFVSAIVEDREPFPNAVQSANWTAAGLCAHESAMRDGERVQIPDFLSL
ncbi:Gfo/Idh/MocA family protein [Pelagicoccus mobilis]|uniref:Gfo/Idh/MocA family oxidoreductase n=1 Tax=Pelagicoccus mobilis TaxID=415221 RepID=A0A934RVL8_9BACT|nr:Gfo/Idh/MocA family oxidoreductase [Pelagicoccus mobilis]MBK1878530.1 Gfo/Idh/MocA family oxidoreductase [Pelagicoccus mobilis]